jgi:N4-(beta-N-acetylglucosaminyl)-L-asparaginase
MSDRRNFLKASLLGASASALALSAKTFGQASKAQPSSAQASAASGKFSGARVVSTWDFGVAANLSAWSILGSGGHALDAVEKGVQVPESDLKNHSVGKGGYPDRDGHVTLDASIMDADGSCGAVAALEHIEHPISVARRVMERTPHVLLVGEGALQFALEQGFKKQNLLTPEAEQAWHEWQKTAKYTPSINNEVRDYGKGAGQPGGAHNHDTIGMLAVDANGRMAGACTTSGMAWKMRGRVGDSPIIGAGLYVDGDVGGATSTGVGEEVIRNAGSFLVVELMRQGRSPHEACKEAVMRIVNKRREASRTLQVGFLAMNRHGEVGAFAIQHGFSYAVCDAQKQDALIPSQSVYTTSFN